MEQEAQMIQGTVLAVVYQNPENGYCVLKVRTGDAQPVTVVGTIPMCVAGERLAIVGKWSRHPSFGQQFEAEFLERLMPESASEILAFLSSRAIKGIGPKTAEKIVSRFGVKSLDILEQDPAQLTQIPGITEKKAQEMSESFQRQSGIRRLIEFLTMYHLPAQLAVRLYRVYGELAQEALRDDPYLLTDAYFHADFSQVDAFAIELGISADDERRVEAGTLFELSYNLGAGHTFIPQDKLRAATCVLLGLDGETIDAREQWVLPGAIDDQVHFREPGLTYKADIRSESAAAAAGGVTSFMDMPNVKPPTVTLGLLDEKFERAAETSVTNYSFYFGATNENAAEIERIDPKRVCGVKVFMGSSTGNMLVDDDRALASIFAQSPVPVATHCEDEATVRANMERFRAGYGDEITVAMHPLIRSAEACYRSSAKAVELATRYGADLHVLHLSTARELDLFDRGPLSGKRITNEVCVHHLWFSDADYARMGNFIKWNPAIKSEADRDALRRGIADGRVDVVATDHAPHTLDEKKLPYLKAPSGGPLVQHSLVAMLEMSRNGVFPVETAVEKMCHAPAVRFRIRERGYLREGYFADIVLVRPDDPWTVSPQNILSKCGWSPFEGVTFSNRVTHTLVNGKIVFRNGAVDRDARGRALEFDR